MVGRLPGCHRAIVTGRAFTSLHHRMTEKGWDPTSGAVATVTVERGGDVGGRLECRCHTSARRVTLITLRRRPFEHALYVTALAWHLGVATGEREPCLPVIEIEGAAAAASLARCLIGESEVCTHNKRSQNRPSEPSPIHPAI